MNGQNVVMQQKERNVSLDVIRIVALLCVISVHFFLNNGFYKNVVVGEKMYLMVIMRTAFMVCVPLFIILTGYLMRKKELSKKYYLGIVKTIGIYVLASIACLIYKAVFLDYSVTLFGIIKGIFNFSLANYSWYIEMYIGLFMLIPFLNLVYNNLKSKEQKKFLVVTMLFLTSFPTLTNIYNFEAGLNLDMFFNNGDLYNKLLPFWWNSLYPISYYFIGAYLNEYGFKISRKLNIILFVLTVLLFGTYNYFCSYNNLFIWGPYQDWGSIQNVIMTVLLFVLLLNFNFNNISQKSKVFLGKISDLCLGAYLVSYIFDNAFYKVLNNTVLKMTDRLYYFVIMVLIVFVCSILLSAFLNIIYSFVSKLFFDYKIHIKIYTYMREIINDRRKIVLFRKIFLYLLLFLLIFVNLKIVVFDTKQNNRFDELNSFDKYSNYYDMINYKDVSVVVDENGRLYISVSGNNDKLKEVKEKQRFYYIHGTYEVSDPFEIRNDFGINAYKFDFNNVKDIFGFEFGKGNYVYVLEFNDNSHKYIDYNSIVYESNLSFENIEIDMFSDIYFNNNKIFIKDKNGNEEDVTSLFEDLY